MVNVKFVVLENSFQISEDILRLSENQSRLVFLILVCTQLLIYKNIFVVYSNLKHFTHLIIYFMYVDFCYALIYML